MAFVHGKAGYISIDSHDISAFCNNIGKKRSADSHDVTTFGAKAHKYAGGLLDGTFDVEGIYDNSSTGPAAVLEPLLGTVVPWEYRPEGTGSALPQQSGEALILSYEETEPVADMVTWKASLQVSGDVTSADQPTTP